MTHSSRSSAEIIALFDRYVIGNYRRFPVALVRGEGVYVWDAEGKRYLDFFPGWGCNLLGHCPPRVVEAVREQVARLIHVPNTWYTELQGLWAQALSERSFGGKAFFCNSGTEANEAAIKLVRLHSPKGRYKIITFEGGFHGRTMGSLSATAQPKYHEGLGPLLPGFVYCPFGDLDEVAKRIDNETAAIMIEPIQGEGGVVVPPEGFLVGLRKLADEHGLLLVFDEVQTGCGRTGHWFGYQYFGVTPDIMTLAKSVCGGLPGGVMLAKGDVATSLRPGMHASTFGGNPIAAAAGLATIEMIEEENLLARAQHISRIFQERLVAMQQGCSIIREVRIVGLMIGIELTLEGAPVVQECLNRGLLINCTHNTVIRLLPAMVMTDEQVHEGCDILEDVLKKYAAGKL
ncbi:MAG: aspartate aminotransferase family protein [Thermogutta sp.]